MKLRFRDDERFTISLCRDKVAGDIKEQYRFFLCLTDDTKKKRWETEIITSVFNWLVMHKIEGMNHWERLESGITGVRFNKNNEDPCGEKPWFVVVPYDSKHSSRSITVREAKKTIRGLIRECAPGIKVVFS
jgi:ADP-heptose:LPS heptosyltransferase